MDQTYRKERIELLIKQLDADWLFYINKYRMYEKKCSRLTKAEYGINACIMATGMSSVSAIAAPPAGIGMGIIAGLLGICNIVIKTVHKKTTDQKKKLDNVLNILSKNKTKISLMVSNIIDDNIIDLEELVKISDAYKEYRNEMPPGASV